MLVCAGASVCVSVCGCMGVCVRACACVRACVCLRADVRACVYALRTVSTDKILHSINTFIIIMTAVRSGSKTSHSSHTTGIWRTSIHYYAPELLSGLFHISPKQDALAMEVVISTHLCVCESMLFMSRGVHEHRHDYRQVFVRLASFRSVTWT